MYSYGNLSSVQGGIDDHGVIGEPRVELLTLLPLPRRVLNEKLQMLFWLHSSPKYVPNLTIKPR